MSESKSPLIDVSRLPVEPGVHKLIAHAASLPASDVFYSSNEHNVTVGVRHLGIIHTICVLPLEVGRKHIAHMKAASGMDVSEKRRPLDGRWLHKSENGKVVDLRINMVPTLYGEDLAVRILSRDTHLFTVEGLGLSSEQFNELTNMLETPSGLILITGPTGSRQDRHALRLLLQVRLDTTAAARSTPSRTRSSSPSTACASRRSTRASTWASPSCCAASCGRAPTSS